MPGGAAELAVGDHMVACGLLLGHQLGDAPVLHLFQLPGVDGARLKIGAGLSVPDSKGMQKKAYPVWRTPSYAPLSGLGPPEIRPFLKSPIRSA